MEQKLKELSREQLLQIIRKTAEILPEDGRQKLEEIIGRVRQEVRRSKKRRWGFGCHRRL